MKKLNTRGKVAASVLALALAAGVYTHQQEEKIIVEYRVAEAVFTRVYEGDTAYELVLKYNKHMDDEQITINEMLAKFEELNGTLDIVAGQRYGIPVYEIKN